MKKPDAAVALAAAAAGVFAAGACTGVATNIGGKPGPEAGLLRGKSPSTSTAYTVWWPSAFARRYPIWSFSLLVSSYFPAK